MFTLVVQVFNSRILRLLNRVAVSYDMRVATQNYGKNIFKFYYSKNWLKFKSFLLILHEMQHWKAVGTKLIYRALRKKTARLGISAIIKDEQANLPSKLGARYQQRKILSSRVIKKRTFGAISLRPENKTHFYFFSFKVGPNVLRYNFFKKNFLVKPTNSYICVAFQYVLYLNFLWLQIYIYGKYMLLRNTVFLNN